MSLKAETEMAMKLLEKDIHEKQDTIVSLRRQLDDIKSINLEMYRKLQVRPLVLIDDACRFYLYFVSFAITKLYVYFYITIFILY